MGDRMKQNMLFVPTLRENPRDAEIISHQVLLRGGYIKQVAAGIYTYLPLGYKIIKKIENIIREELNNIGCSELFMPVLQPRALWEESGRWSEYGKELMRLKDRHNRDFALGPTHEEVITYIVRDYLNSYKKFPVALYQIQTKFRDELRPRFGLMRGREFSMKDLYTFHTSKEDLDKWYEMVSDAYIRIFKRCGLDVKIVKSETGQIGGDEAHEFMVMKKVGENTITYCTKCEYGANIEYSNLKENDKCPKCDGKIALAKGIEIGNIFKLGTKYSEAMNAYYMDEKGNQKPIIMGCYGIGVSRLLMAVIEQHFQNGKMIWPKEISPFDVHLIVINNDYEKEADELYNKLKEHNIDVLLDNRDESAGVKLADADLIGIPTRIIIGRDMTKNMVELIYNEKIETINYNDVLKKLT